MEGVRVSPTLQPGKDSREVGRLGVWSVTTAKPGNGVELLRDGRDDTYWQSDGAQPHLVNIQFQRKVFLKEVAVQLDFKLDESYTPTKMSVSRLLAGVGGWVGAGGMGGGSWKRGATARGASPTSSRAPAGG